MKSISIVFLILNGTEVEADESELEKIVLLAAEGKAGKAKIARFFQDHLDKK